MNHRALAALALMMTACSHDERPAASSASTVDRATDVPSNNPDFTPSENRIGDANDAGVQTAPGANATPSGTSATTGTSSTSTTTTTGTSNPTSTTASGPANTGTNGSSSTNRTASAAPAGTASTRPDNSDVNERDRARSAVTPMDQGESEADRTITQQIRQAVMKDGSLSFTAKNVKIITLNRKVTLRGPVKSAAERTSIEAAAKKVAGVTSVENQLEIAD